MLYRIAIKMKTPVFDFVKAYSDGSISRFHMPGHKGAPVLGCEPFDITEISGADELYRPEGIILESEKNAARLFGTARTVYSAGGSSQSINAMLALAMQRVGQTSERPLVLAGRNAHKAFIYAAAKLDFDIEWLYSQGDSTLCSCRISAETLEKRLSELDRTPFAVYITSPDYFGGMTDIKALSRVLRKRNIPLLVDNAHGAYLAFLPEKLHPILLGADMCCDSAHKTLPVLTGGGYLHIAESDRYNFSENAVKAMEIFGSTSPSYLILQSLDLCNRYIAEKIRSDLENCLKKVAEIKRVLKGLGISDISDEPLKIAADFSAFSVKGKELSDYFRKNGIEFEYSDGKRVVFMVTPQNTQEDFDRLKRAFEAIPLNRTKANSEITVPPASKRVMTVREAVFAPCKEVAADEALGKICSSPCISCPPAVPIAVSGEIINKEHIALFKHFGIKKVQVVIEK